MAGISSGGGPFKLSAGRMNKAPSYNEILPRLYLGDICMAINKDGLTNLGITDMISVEIKPLSASDLAPCVKRYLYINVMDHSKQDILSHFETSNEFIETALKNPSNKVYVHCVAGISRSASLVIAYIMKSRSMSYTEAHELVVQKRPIVDPNEGFVRQLTLYHKMKYTIDIGNIEYRRIVLDALVFEFRLISLSYYQTHSSKTGTSSGGGSSSIVRTLDMGQKNATNKSNIGILFDHYYNKLHLQQVSQHPDVYDARSAFKCNKCRAIVFYAISVIENRYPDTVDSTQRTASTMAPKQLRTTHSGQSCPFIFIEPQPWMSRNVLERDGNLDCYKCKRKLGKFDWTSGESCSCELHNSHMNHNLFKIMKKKVDMA